MNFIFGLLMYGAAGVKKGKNYLAICILSGIVLYFVYAIVSVLITFLYEKINWITHLNYLFIFNVMNMSGLAVGGKITFNWQPIVIWLVPAIALNIWGYFRYQKKDLNCA
ncbi:MAG TPA: hypothetical protein VIL03_05060 [Clostridia bacterium]